MTSHSSLSALDSLDVAHRLQLIERLVVDLHWCFLGQWLQPPTLYEQRDAENMLTVPSPRVQSPRHISNATSDTEEARTSSSKRRRQRAKAVKAKLWSQMRAPRTISDNECSPTSTIATQTSAIDIADFRRMPEHAWQGIHDRFATFRQLQPQSMTVTVSSGRVLTLLEATERKTKIVEDEERRLSELKGVISNFIRASDGSQHSRNDIAAMTAALHNALKLLDYARDLSVHEFFHECPLKSCRI